MLVGPDHADPNKYEMDQTYISYFNIRHPSPVPIYLETRTPHMLTASTRDSYMETRRVPSSFDVQ